MKRSKIIRPIRHSPRRWIDLNFWTSILAFVAFVVEDDKASAKVNLQQKQWMHGDNNAKLHCIKLKIYCWKVLSWNLHNSKSFVLSTSPTQIVNHPVMSKTLQHNFLTASFETKLIMNRKWLLMKIVALWTAADAFLAIYNRSGW